MTIDELIRVWNAYPRRDSLITDRLAGEYIPAELKANRIDGRPKSKVIAAWEEAILSFWVGFLGGKDIKYEALGEADQASVDHWRLQYKQLNLHKIDSLTLETALTFGEAVEVVSLVNGKVKVTSYDPTHWAFIEEEGEPVIAILKVVVPKGTILRGELTKREHTFFWIYSDERVQEVEITESGPRVRSDNEHPFGRLPVIRYRVDKTGQGLFTTNLLNMIDDFNICRSSLSDSIKYGIDPLLLLTGLSLRQLFSSEVVASIPNQDGSETEVRKSLSSVIKETGVLCLPDKEASANFISKSVSIEQLKYALLCSWASIHQAASIPDLTIAPGSTAPVISSVSGVALKMKFQTSLHRGEKIGRYFEPGLERRFDLLQRVNEIMRKPRFNAEASLDPRLPVNEAEWAMLIAPLMNLLPRQEVANLVPMIENQIIVEE